MTVLGLKLALGDQGFKIAIGNDPKMTPQRVLGDQTEPDHRGARWSEGFRDSKTRENTNKMLENTLREARLDGFGAPEPPRERFYG